MKAIILLEMLRDPFSFNFHSNSTAILQQDLNPECRLCNLQRPLNVADIIKRVIS